MDNDSLRRLESCPNYNKCSQNLCPLDVDLRERSGGMADECRWMREAVQKNIRGRVFVSGGSVMPDAILINVPESNIERLNTPSKERYLKLKQDKQKHDKTKK